MELVQKNIHMEEESFAVFTQISVDSDVNLKDVCPDMSQIILKEGQPFLEAKAVGKDSILVKGYIQIDILYVSDEDPAHLAGMQGIAEVEQTVYHSGILPSDQLETECCLSSLSAEMIHSRKIGVRAGLDVWIRSSHLHDEVITTDVILDEGEMAELKKETAKINCLKGMTNETVNIAKEITLPGAYGNIYRILFWHASLWNQEYRLLDGQLEMTGSVKLFVLYESEDSKEPVQCYESMLAFEEIVELDFADSKGILDISDRLIKKELEIKKDEDGEDRVLGLRMVLGISPKVYEEEETEYLCDAYGIERSLKTQIKEAVFRSILYQADGQIYLEEVMDLTENSAVQKLLFSGAELSVKESKVQDEKLLIDGNCRVNLLYLVQDETLPYRACGQSFAFHHEMEIKNLTGQPLKKLMLKTVSVQTVLMDEKKVALRISASVKGLVFQEPKVTLIQDMSYAENAETPKEKRPGFVVYMVKDTDTLYEIGKQYRVPIKQILQQNEKSDDSIRSGEKLLIMPDFSRE